VQATKTNMGEQRYSPTHSLTLHFAEMIGQFDDPDALQLRNMTVDVPRTQSIFERSIAPRPKLNDNFLGVEPTASCTMGNGTFPEVASGQGVTLTRHPRLVPRSENIARLYIYAP
jgi:hypothetical protein